MTPIVVPLSPGERPTEPGWYIAKFAGDDEIDEQEFGPSPVRVSWCGGFRKDPEELGVTGHYLVGYLPIAYAGLTFIARIYPEHVAVAGAD